MATSTQPLSSVEKGACAFPHTFPWRRDRLDRHKLPGCKTRQMEVHRLIYYDFMQMSIGYLSNEIDPLNCCCKQNTSLQCIK